jgi:hypothetical protein
LVCILLSVPLFPLFFFLTASILHLHESLLILLVFPHHFKLFPCCCWELVITLGSLSISTLNFWGFLFIPCLL